MHRDFGKDFMLAEALDVLNSNYPIVINDCAQGHGDFVDWRRMSTQEIEYLVRVWGSRQEIGSLLNSL
jgi:hypothetical protein